MADRYGAVRQLPCPDCGSPVQPDRDQLCPRCGYPLMFLRRPAEDDARSIPRAPGEREEPTGMLPAPRQPTGPPRPADTRQFPATTYGQPPAGAGRLQCPQCGYASEPVRIRCERCGYELRQARPHAVVLGPAVPQTAPRGSVAWWLVLLIVLAVLSLLALAATVVWQFVL